MEHPVHGGAAPYLDLSGHFPEGVYAYVVLKGHGGVDPESLARFLAERGHRVRRVHRVEQVHSARVVEARETPCPADAVIVRAAGEAARVVTADCVPLLLSAGDASAVAAVHAGWKGTLGAISTAAVRALGGEPARVRAALGPAIGPCCYTVDAKRHATFREAFPEAVPEGAPPHRLDLHAVNAAQLARCGVPPIGIARESRCTSCTVALCSSYRREGEGAGRMAAVIGLED